MVIKLSCFAACGSGCGIEGKGFKLANPTAGTLEAP